MPGVLFLEWGIHFSPNKNYFQVIVLRGRYLSYNSPGNLLLKKPLLLFSFIS